MKKPSLEEEWRPVKGYEGHYEVSSLGRIKSLNYNHTGKEGFLKFNIDGSGYYFVVLSVEGKRKQKIVHQLVAESFLNHTKNGFVSVVNHKDFNRLNNHVSNLEIISQRENSNKKHLNCTSKYTGVSWSKTSKKWRSQIKIKGKIIYLGSYDSELEASNAYQKQLTKIKL